MSEALQPKTLLVSNRKHKGAIEVWRHDSYPRALFRNPNDTYYYEVNGERGPHEEGRLCLLDFWNQNPDIRPPTESLNEAGVAVSRPGPESGTVPKSLTTQGEENKSERGIVPVLLAEPLIDEPHTQHKSTSCQTRVHHFTVDLTGFVEVCSVLFERVREEDDDYYNIDSMLREMSLYLIQCLWMKMGKFHPSSPEWIGAFERILKNSGLQGIYVPSIISDYFDNLGDCSTDAAEFKLFMPTACYPVSGGEAFTAGIDLASNELNMSMFPDSLSEDVREQVLQPRLIYLSPGTLGEYNILTHSAYRSLPTPWAAWVACSGFKAMLPRAQISPDVRSDVVVFGAIVRPGNSKAVAAHLDEPQLCLNYRQFAKCSRLFNAHRDLFKSVLVTEMSRKGSLASTVLVERRGNTRLRCAVITPEQLLLRSAAYCYRLRRTYVCNDSSIPALTEYNPEQPSVRESWQATAEDLLFMRRSFSGPAQLAGDSPLITGTVIKALVTGFAIRTLIDQF